MIAATTLIVQDTDEGRPVSRDGAEGAIARALTAGDRRSALRLVAKAYAAPLGRLCAAMTGSRSDADDLVQETLLEAHRALPNWRGEGSVKAFVMTIGRRKCARFLETRARRGSKLRLVRDDERQRRELRELLPESAALGRERASRAREALADLSDDEREAVLLRYAADLSFREVAEACGIAEAAARKRVSRALGRMRDRVARPTEVEDVEA